MIKRLACILLLTCSACTQLVTDSPSAADRTAFINMSLWSAQLEQPIENAVLLVEDGRVVDLFSGGDRAIPSGYAVVDLDGSWVIPGIVSAHSHINSAPGFHRDDHPPASEAVAAQLWLFAHYGVTSVFSMGNEPREAFAWRDDSQTAEHRRARLYLASPRIDANSPEEARTLVEEGAADAPDYFKIRVDDELNTQPSMDEETYSSAIEEANDKGFQVAAHMVKYDDAVGLLNAGVRLLAHSVRDREVGPEFTQLLIDRNACLSPTLMREVASFSYADRPAFLDDPLFAETAGNAIIARINSPETRQRFMSPQAAWYRDHLPVAQENMLRIYRAGGTLAMGPDTGPGIRPQGYFERLEMEMMEDAGLPAIAVLRASTVNPARCLDREGDVGTLQAGRWADFLVLDEDPLQSVRAVRSLTAVYIGGQLLQ